MPSKSVSAYECRSVGDWDRRRRSATPPINIHIHMYLYI